MYSTAFSTVRTQSYVSLLHAMLNSPRLARSTLTTVDLVGLLVGDLNAELLLEGGLAIGAVGVFPEGKRIAYLLNGHHDLNGVQAVKAEVVGEVGDASDLIGMSMSVCGCFRRPRALLVAMPGVTGCCVNETDLAGVGNLKSARMSVSLFSEQCEDIAMCGVIEDRIGSAQKPRAHGPCRNSSTG